MSESSAATTLGPIAMSSEREPGRGGSETRTIRAAQRGSQDAIEQLVRRHWPDAYATAFALVGDRLAAEDVAQDAILAAIDALDGFDRRRPFAPWLQRIVVNRALDWLRARSRRPEVPLGSPGAPIAAAPDEIHSFSRGVVAALGKLAPRERAIVVLRHVAGFDSKEIGEILDMSATAVRSALRRALQRMRDELGGERSSTTGVDVEDAP